FGGGVVGVGAEGFAGPCRTAGRRRPECLRGRWGIFRQDWRRCEDDSESDSAASATHRLRSRGYRARYLHPGDLRSAISVVADARARSTRWPPNAALLDWVVGLRLSCDRAACERAGRDQTSL